MKKNTDLSALANLLSVPDNQSPDTGYTEEACLIITGTPDAGACKIVNVANHFFAFGNTRLLDSIINVGDWGRIQI